MRMRLIVTFCILLFQALTALGQSPFRELPVHFLQVPESYPLINPSYVAVENGLTVRSGNKMNFGPFKIFRTHFVAANYSLKPKDSIRGNNHGFGLTVLTDKDGEYIQHNRLYISYAYKIRLSEKFSIATGISLGGLNTSIESTNVSPPGSAIAPDGNIGMWLYQPKSYFGISVNQLLNSTITPINESYKLVRHLTLIAGKDINISSGLSLSSALSTRFSTGVDPDIDFINQLFINNIVGAGVNYRHHKGVVFMAGFKNLPFRNGKHAGGGWFSYSIPFSKYVISSLQTYEITLSYKIY